MRISDWSSDVCSSDLTGAERPALALARPRPAGGLLAVHRQPGAEGGDQDSADAVGTAGLRVRLRMDEERVADIVPSESNLLVERGDPFGPEMAGVAGSAEQIGRAHV